MKSFAAEADGKASENVAEAIQARTEISPDSFDHPLWDGARPVLIERYWSGAEAPPERHAEARLVWTDEALLVRFVCRQHEPLVIGDEPRTDMKTIGLWDRDVCEIFLAPEASTPERYYEFEAAPTGEWLDLSILWTPEGRQTDWEFRSGMRAAARVERESVTVVMRVPFTSLLGRAGAPRVGERWRANLFRCVGAGETRGYLAWQPTYTPEPGFHVPEKFGWLEFKGSSR